MYIMWPWEDEKPKTVFESLFGKKTKKSKDCNADILKVVAKMRDKILKHDKAQTKKCDKRVRKAERLHRKLGLSELDSLSDLDDSSDSYESSDLYDARGDCRELQRKYDDLKRTHDALKRGNPTRRSYANKKMKIKFAVVRADTLRSTQIRADLIPYADQDRLKAHAKQVVPLVKQVAQVSDVEVVMQANAVVVSLHVASGRTDDIRRAVRSFPYKVIGGLYRLKDPTVS